MDIYDTVKDLHLVFQLKIQKYFFGNVESI